MSTTARSAERVVGLFLFFVEMGAVIDSQTVSASVYPDGDPTSNWLSLGNVLPGAQLETETEDDSYMKLESNRYRKVQVTDVVADYLAFRTREMSGIVDRLQFGASGAITEGTAKTAFSEVDRYVEGWLLSQGRNLRGSRRGQDDHRLLIQCRLRLAAPVTHDSKAQSPQLRAEIITNAANSILWPAAA